MCQLHGTHVKQEDSNIPSDLMTLPSSSSIPPAVQFPTPETPTRHLFRTPITVAVGPGGQAFPLHLEILLTVSPFFAAAYNPKYTFRDSPAGSYSPAHKSSSSKLDLNKLTLPSITPSDFEYFIQWLYTRTLDHEDLVGPHPAYFKLIRLYRLADQLQVTALKNAVVWFVAEVADRTNSCPTPDDTRVVWNDESGCGTSTCLSRFHYRQRLCHHQHQQQQQQQQHHHQHHSQHHAAAADQQHHPGCGVPTRVHGQPVHLMTPSSSRDRHGQRVSKRTSHRHPHAPGPTGAAHNMHGESSSSSHSPLIQSEDSEMSQPDDEEEEEAEEDDEEEAEDDEEAEDEETEDNAAAAPDAADRMDDAEDMTHEVGATSSSSTSSSTPASPSTAATSPRSASSNKRDSASSSTSTAPSCETCCYYCCSSSAFSSCTHPHEHGNGNKHAKLSSTHAHHRHNASGSSSTRSRRHQHAQQQQSQHAQGERFPQLDFSQAPSPTSHAHQHAQQHQHAHQHAQPQPHTIPAPTDEAGGLRELISDLFVWKNTDRLIAEHVDQWDERFLREVIVKLKREKERGDPAPWRERRKACRRYHVHDEWAPSCCE